MLTITYGEIRKNKQLELKEVAHLVVGENRSTMLCIEIPSELSDYDFYVVLSDSKGSTSVSPKVDVETVKAEEEDGEDKYYINYLFLNDALKTTGRLLLQIEANKNINDVIVTYKTLINQQLCVSTAINAVAGLEELPNLVAETQMAIDHANEVANQLIEDKAAGIFDGKDGDKGAKGDPSTLDKIGINATVINLSDRDVSTFGTQDAPILISEESTITFVGYTPIPGYKKSFELCIKRTADVAVIWAQITEPNWAYREIPLLPVGKRQEIKVRTVDGVNYYGTGGDVF